MSMLFGSGRPRNDHHSSDDDDEDESSSWGSSGAGSSGDNSSILASDTERGAGSDAALPSGFSGWSLLRRRGATTSNTDSAENGGAGDHNSDEGEQDISGRGDSNNHHHGHKHGITNSVCKRGTKRSSSTTTSKPRSWCVCCICCCCRTCKYFIIFCTLLTTFRLLLVKYREHTRYKTLSDPTLPIRERTRLRTEGTAAKNTSFLQEIQNRIVDGGVRGVQHSQAVSKEDLPPGCERPAWHEFNLPNCNDFHEIDLAAVLATPDEQLNDDHYLGYVNSGLWRSVWAVNPRATMTEHIVLKMMEMEHDVNTRNFDRHRRDALTMEMLSSSPYVVDGYGFCGNSVLTEFLDLPLDKVVRVSETDRLNGGKGVTRITAAMRVQWAVDVAKGVEALHEIEGGPIVHADIQAKQFLVSPTTGRVKVNDFNRCRFMAQPQGAKSGPACPFRIPSAPGKMRSPEEYKYDKLTEKLDIYSVANILYSLLTKEKAWNDLGQGETKNFIKKGKIPKIVVADDIEMPEKLKQALVDINERAYQLDPKKRISAADMAYELQKVLDQLEK